MKIKHKAVDPAIVAAATPAIKANFSAEQNTLFVTGNTNSNELVISRDAAGELRINNGALAIAGGTPTVANTTLIQVVGVGGNDVITLNETNGALPNAKLFGGAGNDQLTGSAGGDTLLGEANNDALAGKGGDDFLFGGGGDDVVLGGAGDDQMFGEAGNDRMIWNPGEGSDLMEGGSEIDTAEINGGSGAEEFTIQANGTRVRFDRVAPTGFTLDIGTTEKLVLNAGGGNDVVTAGNGLAALIALTIDGGLGDDTLTGGDGGDLLIGGEGDDVVTGGRGNDDALLGDGEDVFTWVPGHGSDIVDGGAGSDLLDFAGSVIAEKFAISAAGGHARLTRDVAAVTMDLANMESLFIHALGGADRITIGSLSGTGVKQVIVDLGLSSGGGESDGAVDVVTVSGSSAADSITLVGDADQLMIAGLPATIIVTNGDLTDQVIVEGGSGNDSISATLVGGFGVTLDGGAGADTIVGGGAADTLVGGDQNDVVSGGHGDDTAFLGTGDDRFRWKFGDGSDVVEGQDGTDTLEITDDAAANAYVLTANAGRLRVAVDGTLAVLDVNDIERVTIHAGEGADLISIGDVSATDVKQVTFDLAKLPGGSAGDGQIDQVLIAGSALADAFTVAGTGDKIVVNGGGAAVTILHADANDSLQLSTGAENDTIDAHALTGVELFVDAGEGNDTLLGSVGDDILLGGTGDDVVTGGKGDDLVLLGDNDDRFLRTASEGEDRVFGEGGFDEILYRGALGADTLSLHANGKTLTMIDVGNDALVQALGVEQVTFFGQSGADEIAIDDLSATDVQKVIVDLGVKAGGTAADGTKDSVTINGTAAGDFIELRHQADGGVDVLGLKVVVAIEHGEAGDLIRVNGGGGADFLLVTADPADGRFTLDGGEGNETIFGGAGNDVIIGGASADELDGGKGIDTLDYSGSSEGVRIDLGAGTASGGDATGDSFFSFEIVRGSGFGDLLIGSALQDMLLGGDGADELRGLAGVDDLRGDGGADLLIGGGSLDKLTGGAGADVFAYVALSDSAGTQRDTILDFSHAQGDRIDLSALDANLSLDGDQAFKFLGTGAFDGGKGELRLEFGNGFATLLADVNGDKVADFAVTLTGIDAAHALVSGDFVL